MNLPQRATLSLLLVCFGAMPAAASLSGDGGSGDMSIETVANSDTLHHLDKLLGGRDHSDLIGSVLNQHASAALPATGVMEGESGSEGAEKPKVFGKLSPSSRTMPPAPSEAPAEVPNLSLTVAAHLGGGAQADAASASASSPSSSSASGSFAPSDSIAPTDTTTPVSPASPVPLPAAGLLLASGLVGLPVMRRLRQV